MNYSFLLFRCKQVGRYVQRTGVLFIILPLLLLSGTIFKGMENLILLSDVNLVLLYLFVIIGILYQRTDYHFLKHSEQSLFLIYLVDVGLITIPFCIPFLILGKGLAVVGALIAGFCMSLVWPFIASLINSREIKSNALKVDVPSPDLELKYIARKYGIFLCLLYVVCLFYAAYPAAIFVITFIFLGVFQSALEFFEPKEMIFYHDSAEHFLHAKIFRMWYSIQLLLIPFYLIGLYFSPSYWFLFLLVFLASTLMIIFSICNKYVFYRPSLLKYNTNMLGGIMLLFMLMPGFQLVVLFMSIVQYFKAKKNLNFYW